MTKLIFVTSSFDIDLPELICFSSLNIGIQPISKPLIVLK
jgi:hypothetical protein